MCGRYTQTLPTERLAEIFRVSRQLPVPGIGYDIRPTTRVASVRLDASGERVLTALPWMWKHAKFQHCNAKGENVRRYPAYRESFAHRRCLVPATGYFEWAPIPGTKLKQRFYIERIDGKLLAFAGLFNEDSSMMATMTMPANTEISQVHNRTPVFIEESDWERYLDPEPLNDDEKHRMISTPSEGTFRFWPVANKAVGSDLLKEIPLDDAPSPQRPVKKSAMEGQGDLF